ncbi:class I SAM-dependent methyltransferase [Kribbella koreensis]|uniref:Class I SAM-dependent methyltransferase n=1 Tax=Kribbella koreensis TaxID=57909 RepID=A0ABP3ZVF4_9ACTN
MSIVMNHPSEDLTFMTPLSQARAGRLTEFLATSPQRHKEQRVLDLGCGWGELLLRVVEASPTARGIGIDLDQPAIEHGRKLARDRGLADRVTFTDGDAKAQPDGSADAVICIGASQIWGPPVEARQPLDYVSALRALRKLVAPGGRVLYGEGIWSRTPTPEAIAPLAGRPDEFVGMGELIELAVAHGFQPIQVHEANLDEWDEFESGSNARYTRWLAEHGTGHPDADGILARAAAKRAAYFGGYRSILGMAYLALVAV